MKCGREPMAGTKSKIGLLISVALLLALGAGGMIFLARGDKSDTATPPREEGSFPETGGERPGRRSESRPRRIKITGKPEFEKQVRQALNLIWIYDRQKFYFTSKRIFEIKQADSTEFRIINQTPTILISNKNAFPSATWCAGIIAHHAFHAWASSLKNKEKKRIPPPPGTKADFEIANPLGVKYTALDTILKVEEKASEFQIRLLRKIGAPKREIRTLLNRYPKDFSVSHDGAYSINP